MAVDAGTIFAEVRIALDKLTGDVQSVQKSFDQFAQKNKQQATEVEKSWTDGFQKMKLEQVAAFAAIGIAVAKSVEYFTNFQNAMADVRIQARATPEDFKLMEDAAKKAAETTHVAAVDAAEALRTITASGYGATDAIVALDGALLLASATDADMGTVTKTLTTLLNQFSLKASDSTKIANIFSAAISKSHTNIEGLSAAFQSIGPLAAQLGLKIEDVTGAIAVMANAGFDGETAGMALRNVLGSLADATGPVVKQLLALGMSYDDINPATNSLSDVVGALAANAAVADNVFGIFGNRIGGPLLTLLKAGKVGVDEFTKAVTDTNAAAEAAAIRDATLGESTEMLENAFKGAGVALVEGIAPALKVLVDTLTGAVNWFSKLPEPVKTFIALTAAGIPVVMGASVAIGILAGVIGTVAGPITLVVAGLSLLAAGFIAVKKASDEAKLKEVREDYKDVAEQLGVTEQEMVKLVDASKQTGLDVEDVDKFSKALGIAAKDLSWITDAMLQGARSGMAAREQVEALSDSLEVSQKSLIEIGLANENITGQYRDQLLEMQKRIPLGLNIRDADRARAEAEAIEQKKIAAEKEALDAAAAKAAAKREADRLAALQALGMARLKAESEYSTSIDRTQTLLDNGLITTKESVEQHIKSVESLIDALIDLGYKGAGGVANVNGELSKGDQDIVSATESLAVLKGVLASMGEDEGMKKVAEDTEAAKATAANYLDMLQRLGKTTEELTELDRQRAIADVKATSATAEAQQIAIDNINAYFDALSAANAESKNSLAATDEYRDKLERLNATEEELIDLEERRAIAQAREYGATEEAIAAAVVAIQAYYAALRDTSASEKQKKAAEELRDKIESVADSITDYFVKFYSGILSILSAMADKQIDEIDRELEAYLESLDDKEKAAQEQYDRDLERIETSTDAKIDAIDRELAAALGAAGVAEETTIERLRRELAEAIATGKSKNIEEAQDALTRYQIEQEYSDKRQKLLDDEAAAKKKLDAERAALEQAAALAKEKAEEAAAKKKAQLEYRMALNSWRLQLTEAIIDTARLTINGLLTKPFIPAGLIAGILAGGLGAVQIAGIVASKPEAPAMAYGGIVLPSRGGSLVRAAENGSPELLLNGGAEGDAYLERFAEKIAAQMKGVNGSVTIPLYLDGKKVAESSARYFNKGITRLDV